MPILRAPTPQELQVLEQQGVDISQLPDKLLFPDDNEQPTGSVGKLATVGRVTAANAGGTLGGGAGFLAGANPALPWNATAIAAAPETAGVSLIVPVVSGVVGSIAGGYGGQKLQNAIQGQDITAKLQAAAQEAEQEHPYIAAGTQIGESALASGGALNPTMTVRGVRGLIPAIVGKGLSRDTVQVLGSSAVNPAIGNAISLAQGQGLLSPREDVEQAVGGALFPEQSRLGRRFSGQPRELVRPQQTIEPTGVPVETQPAVVPIRHEAEQFKLPLEEDEGDNSGEGILARSKPVPQDIEPTEAESFETAIPNKAVEPSKSLEISVGDLKKLQDLGYGKDEISRMTPDDVRNTISYGDSLSSNKYAPLKDEGEPDFLVNGAKLIYDFDELGLRPNRSGAFNGSQLVGTLKNKLSPTEWNYYKDAGIEQAFGGRNVRPEDAAEWMKEAAPRVEVRKLGAFDSDANEANKRSSQLLHEMENAGYTLQFGNDGKVLRVYKDNIPQIGTLPKEFEDRVKELDSLSSKVNKASSESATARYTMVNPKPLEQMPEAVDLKVHVGGKKLYSSSHYPITGDNLLAHVRGYMENIGGKKVFRVFEVQSDWGQKVREIKAEGKAKYGENSPYTPTDHPLLRDYNRLALKAAIEHARQNGADAIVIDDAPTAMLTEGHDREAQRTTPETQSWKTGEHGYNIPQESGMRLNYDALLPRIAEELTGSKGVRVEMGKHQNAINPHESLNLEERNKPRSDLIFRNPDGTPKATSTGLMFDISKVPSRAPRMFGNRYAPDNASRLTELANRANRTSDEEAEYRQLKQQSDSNNSRQAFERVKPLPQEVQDHILSGKATTGSVLQSIANSNHAWSELARKLLSASDTRSLSTPWIGVTGRSHYRLGDNEVRIAEGDAKDASLVIEEALHSMTSQKLPRLEGTGERYLQAIQAELANPKLHPAMRDLLEAYIETAQKQGVHTLLFGKDGIAGNPDKAMRTSAGYGMGSIDEFLAQSFKDPKFQRMLDNTPTTDGRTVWQKVVDAVKKLFGLSPKAGSMLERVLRSSSEIISMKERQPLDLEEGKIFAKSEKPEQALKNYRRAFFSFLASRFDKIAHTLRTPTALYVTNGLHRFAGEMDLLTGRYGNRMMQEVSEAVKGGLKPEQIQKVAQYLHQMDDEGKSSVRLMAEEKYLANKLTTTLREMREQQNAEGLKVRDGEEYRAGGVKEEGYYPNSIEPSVVYEWTERPDSELSQQYNRAWIDHTLKKMVEDNAKKDAEYKLSEPELRDATIRMLQDYKSGLAGKRPLQPEFKGLRRPEGYGLPYALTDQNLASNLFRYAKRYARDMAYFKHIQKDPKMLKALNLRDQYGNRPNEADTGGVTDISTTSPVKAAMRSVEGEDPAYLNPAIQAVARAVNNSVMGVGTSLRNLANMPAFIAGYVQLPQLPLVFKALADINTTTEEAYRANATKTNYKTFDVAGDYRRSQNIFINMMDNFSTLARRFQGRDFSDHFEGQYYYTLGKLLAQDNIARARAGNKESLFQLRQFGDLVDGGGESLLRRPATDEDIRRIAKRYVDSSRGTYTAEGLPTWALEGPLAPFTSLSRFSLEKANTIYKDIVAPLKQGIYAPLIRYTLASLGVGIGIEELNKLLSGKRAADPTTVEVLKAGDAEDYFAKAISLLQLASYAGFVGDSLKLAANAAQNKSIKYNQPLSFPLYTFATDTIAGNIADALGAIRQGEDPFQVMGQLISDIGTQGFQTYRYIDANFIHPNDTKRKEKFRDMAVFNQLVEHKPVDSGAATSNPYLNEDIKRFKRTTDLKEAVDLLPTILKKFIEDSKGDPYEFSKKLTSLKENSYQTFPSLESSPMAFKRYLLFLAQTQGSEAATNRLMDYVRQSELNKVKSGIVP